MSQERALPRLKIRSFANPAAGPLPADVGKPRSQSNKRSHGRARKRSTLVGRINVQNSMRQTSLNDFWDSKKCIKIRALRGAFLALAVCWQCEIWTRLDS